MNQPEKIIICGFTGTAVMTAGSELMSKLFDENFSEPEHLETMIARLAPGLSSKGKMIAGWGATWPWGLFLLQYLSSCGSQAGSDTAGEMR